MSSSKKILSFLGAALAAILLTLSAAAQEQPPKEAQAAKEAAALKALIQKTVLTGENLALPTKMEAFGLDMMNAGIKDDTRGDVVESDAWSKKKRLKTTSFDTPKKNFNTTKEDPVMGGATYAVGLGLVVSGEAQDRVTSHLEATTNENLGNKNLAGMPAGGPSKALRAITGSGQSAITHVFYVLLKADARGQVPKPARLVWRQTHGDDVAIASRSTYFVSDLEGNLLNVDENGYSHKGPRARIKYDDKDRQERFRLEKQSWLKTDEDAPKRRP